jgi:hypothetical protein
MIYETAYLGLISVVLEVYTYWGAVHAREVLYHWATSPVLKIIFDVRLLCDFWQIIQKDFKELSDITKIKFFSFLLIIYTGFLSTFV